jgi:hypothetical protein
MNCVARMIILCALSSACASGFAADRRVVICHQTESDARILEISTAALSAHTAHGDYIARFVVDPQKTAVGDGIHFARISDALAAARALRIARGELREAAAGSRSWLRPALFEAAWMPPPVPRSSNSRCSSMCRSSRSTAGFECS